MLPTDQKGVQSVKQEGNITESFVFFHCVRLMYISNSLHDINILTFGDKLEKVGKSCAGGGG